MLKRPRSKRPELSDESLLSPDMLLTPYQAAGHLAVSMDCLRRLVDKGALPYVDMEPNIGRKCWRFPYRRFRIEDLNDLIRRRRFNVKRWDERSEQWPQKAVMMLLGVGRWQMRKLVREHAAGDRSPEAIRRLIEYRYKKEIYREMHSEFVTRARKEDVCPICKRHRNKRSDET